MKKILLILGMAVALSFAGCAQLNTSKGQAVANQAVQYGLVATQIANVLVNADAEVKTAETTLQANKAQFTPAQWAQLESTDTQLHSVLNTVHNITDPATHSNAGNAAAILVNASQLYQVYGQTKALYLTSKAIVEPKLASMSPIDQYNLQKLDQSAKTLDSAVQQLASAAPGTNMTPIIMSALQVAALAAKVALAAGA